MGKKKTEEALGFDTQQMTETVQQAVDGAMDTQPGDPPVTATVTAETGAEETPAAETPAEGTEQAPEQPAGQVPDEIEEIQGYESLKILFSETERIDNAQALARVYPEIAKLENEKKSAVSQFKSQIEAQQAEANKLSGWVRDGFRFGSVGTVVQRNYRTGMLTKMRKDTGEILLERPLDAGEIQMGLRFKKQ